MYIGKSTDQQTFDSSGKIRQTEAMILLSSQIYCLFYHIFCTHTVNRQNVTFKTHQDHLSNLIYNLKCTVG